MTEKKSQQQITNLINEKNELERGLAELQKLNEKDKNNFLNKIEVIIFYKK
jgi:hypothetical protein